MGKFVFLFFHLRITGRESDVWRSSVRENSGDGRVDETRSYSLKEMSKFQAGWPWENRASNGRMVNN